MGYKHKYLIMIFAVVAVSVAILINHKMSDSLSAFEEHYKNKNIDFFESKINGLSDADKDEILDFDLKMSLATNTFLVDVDLIKAIKHDNIRVNLEVLREHSMSFWQNEINNVAFFSPELKDKQQYFIYH